MPSYRLLRSVSVAFVALSGLVAVPGTASALDTVPLHRLLGEPDRLTIAVSGTDRGLDGTYRLRCGPAGGTHPEAEEACERLTKLSEGNRDPFAPLPADTFCTLQHGGSATARVTGHWHGRPVDAKFSRTDGCQIHRWDELVPVLPAA
ncbi:SSI family serine proteinase inhibitor [Streptomyces uncialis]|uniref:SSI family serine proteinase inhibitor n=1 Tax=Streptomyces uncialis TaxID=1048205 RepID=UPI00387039B6|nr:subtilase-type protease inhibitor [Streptomyces uncialis]